ncbi:hypothetical protein G6F46_004095 [Rhizopus delemar]|uniref:Uncharacterized protein n=2 Tax=Rhizopus TaxID=4842 RepID=A0A9P6Z6R6_9FUNG|nr:hypothetical protein G6F55_004640 [Rhizopus delemar]KAG1547380.1 hypothetical protein G6F51_004302 [Rhizopus arrhizus]KAG1500622.1 hypothetical protein G6F54_003593 [Rhizopus delemar]KAG1513647.1 hypothetical protein G6F53_004277 [Rhizopus delemar]KAG1523476.1 hypothetical protein G6F52_004993 [Rhizopus delemar]
MSVSSKGSFDYKYVNNPSINHPSIDRNLNDSFSSCESIERSPLRLPSSGNRSRDKISIKSEPIMRKTILTEQELARHNSMYEQSCYKEEEGKRLLECVEERCELLKREFEARMKHLEEQFTKTEQEFSQSRCDIEELQSLEKEYINQGIQTDLRCEDINEIEVMIDN